MKQKNLEKLIKLTKHIDLIEGADELWIGNGFAAAPLYDFQKLTDDQAKALFNFAEKDEGKIVIVRTAANELMENDAPGEVQLAPPLMRITLGDSVYDVFNGPEGTLWIPAELLAPFLREDDNARLFARPNDAGRWIVAVKRGFFLAGLIEPRQNVITEQLCSTLESLYVQTARQIDAAGGSDMRAIKGGLR